jgi:hypothetical protein
MRAATKLAVVTLSTVTALGVGSCPSTYAAEADGFTGVWVSIDFDDSHQTLVVRGAGPSHRSATYHDDVASRACAGAPATIVGHADVDGDIMIVSGDLRCEPGTRPLGFVTLGFEYQPGDDTLLDADGITWTRQ